MEEEGRQAMVYFIGLTRFFFTDLVDVLATTSSRNLAHAYMSYAHVLFILHYSIHFTYHVVQCTCCLCLYTYSTRLHGFIYTSIHCL